jgi:hypothetical protein
LGDEGAELLVGRDAAGQNSEHHRQKNDG